MNKKDKKSLLPIPPVFTEEGLPNSADYNISFANPLRKGEGRMIVTRKYAAREIGTFGKQQIKNHLTSIHLIGDSLIPSEVIYLVLDEKYMPQIRFAVRNRKGKETVMKKLYNLVYQNQYPVSDKKRFGYDKQLANGINNDLFNKKRQVADYIKSNKLEKPQLVMKSPDGTLALSGKIPVKIIRPAAVPTQYRSSYEKGT